MKTSHRKTRSAVLAAAVVLAPAGASAYVLLSPARHFASTPIQVCVRSPGHVSVTASDPDQGVTSTIHALEGTHALLAGTGWNVGRLAPLVQNAPCTTPWVLGDGNPTIAFDQMISGSCGGSCLAATFVGYFDCDPLLPDGHCVIDDADVETRRNRADRHGGPFYSLYEPCTAGREWNLEAVMVHEQGHQIGLDHSSIASATMYPTVVSCDSGNAVLAPDDLAGRDVLYP
jgi:hypothetical protein